MLARPVPSQHLKVKLSLSGFLLHKTRKTGGSSGKRSLSPPGPEPWCSARSPALGGCRSPGDTRRRQEWS